MKPNVGGLEVFVHISAVEDLAITMLFEGSRVSCELKPNRTGKVSAESLRIGRKCKSGFALVSARAN